MVETQVMILGRYLHTFQTSGECSCAVCRKVDGKDSIFCSGFSFWVLKSILISKIYWLKILMLSEGGVLVMHRKFMEELVLESNLLMTRFM